MVMSAQDPTQKNPTNIEDWSDDDSFKQLEESTSQKNDTDGFGEIFEFDDTKTSANDLDDILQDFEQIDLTSNQSGTADDSFHMDFGQDSLEKNSSLEQNIDASDDFAVAQNFDAQQDNQTNAAQSIDIDTLGSNHLDADTLPNINATAADPAADKLAASLDNLSANSPEPEPIVAAAPAKKSLFGSNKKQPRQKKSSFGAAKKSTNANANLSKIANSPKSLNLIILGAVIALLLLVAAWFLANSDDAPTSPAEAPTAVPAQVETPAEPTQQDSAAQPATDSTTESTAEPTVAPVADDALVNAEAILNAEIPQDEVLIKEEIDRLKDKDSQLAEQAKLIDEQLATLDQLTAAKEEHIKLLEAQIEQLEAQKGN